MSMFKHLFSSPPTTESIESDCSPLSPEFADAIHFLLSKPDPLDTILRQSDDGLAFEISTPSRFLSSDVTTIRRVEPGHSDGKIIATIKWHHYEPDRIEIMWLTGDSVLLERFLRKEGESVHLRSFTCKERSFIWKWRDNHYELMDMHDFLLARDQRSKIGHFVPDSVPVSLDVSTGALDMLDLIVITYVCAEQQRRQKASSRRDPVAAATVMAFK